MCKLTMHVREFVHSLKYQLQTLQFQKQQLTQHSQPKLFEKEIFYWSRTNATNKVVQ